MDGRFMQQVSTYAADIDNLILLIGVLVGFWWLLAEGVLIYFVLRFRHVDDVNARGQYITGEEKHQKRWITIPHALVLVCDVFIIVGAIRVWVDVKQTLPEPDHTIQVVAQQWAWSFIHPGPDGELNTADDIKTVDEMHVEVGKTYHYQLVSRDVLHDFSVPAFRLKQDSIPGRQITGWFKATDTGAFDIQCAEMCGIGHGLMPAVLYVEDKATHAAWNKANSPVVAAAPAPEPAKAEEPAKVEEAAPAETAPEAAAPAEAAAQP